MKLTEVMESVKTKATAALDEAKAATKKADVAAFKYADLVKEIGVLTRRAKVMEDRK